MWLALLVLVVAVGVIVIVIVFLFVPLVVRVVLTNFSCEGFGMNYPFHLVRGERQKSCVRRLRLHHNVFDILQQNLHIFLQFYHTSLQTLLLFNRSFTHRSLTPIVTHFSCTNLNNTRRSWHGWLEPIDL